MTGDRHFMPDSLVEIKPTGKTTGEVVWEWHLWDHLVQDHDSTKANFGVVADHPELVDANFTPEPFAPGGAPKNASKDAPKDAPKDAVKKEAAGDQKPAQAKSKAEVDKLKSIGYAGSAASQAHTIGMKSPTQPVASGQWCANT